MANLGYIGNTDQKWFEFLRANSPLEEVNFWQPGTPQTFRVVAPGAPFFFRLKGGRRAIGGMGFFSRWVKVPMGIAWDTFGIANGAASLAAWRQSFSAYRERSAAAGTDEVGCIILFRPVFFPEDQWIPEPIGWQGHQPKGVSVDIDTGEGKRIFDACMERLLLSQGQSETQFTGTTPVGERFGTPYLTKPRLGQGAFRLGVTDAYDRACAVTGEHSLPVLDAAHIRPYADDGEHSVSNGLLLRTDIHRLFDLGYVSVTPDMKFQVSRRLRDDFANGKTYYDMRDRVLRETKSKTDRPNKVMLEWHYDSKFLGL